MMKVNTTLQSMTISNSVSISNNQPGICRLCVRICNKNFSLYGEKGRRTNVYRLTTKYFTPMLLTMECGKHFTVICAKCWNLIWEFDSFQRSVHLAQRKLAQGYSSEKTSHDADLTAATVSNSKEMQNVEDLTSLTVNNSEDSRQFVDLTSDQVSNSKETQNVADLTPVAVNNTKETRSVADLTSVPVKSSKESRPVADLTSVSINNSKETRSVAVLTSVPVYKHKDSRQFVDLTSVPFNNSKEMRPVVDPVSNSKETRPVADLISAPVNNSEENRPVAINNSKETRSVVDISSVPVYKSKDSRQFIERTPALVNNSKEMRPFADLTSVPVKSSEESRPVADLISAPDCQSKDALQFVDLTSAPVNNSKETRHVADLTSVPVKSSEESRSVADLTSVTINNSKETRSVADLTSVPVYKPKDSRQFVDLTSVPFNNSKEMRPVADLTSVSNSKETRPVADQTSAPVNNSEEIRPVAINNSKETRSVADLTLLPAYKSKDSRQFIDLTPALVNNSMEMRPVADLTSVTINNSKESQPLADLTSVPVYKPKDSRQFVDLTSAPAETRPVADLTSATINNSKETRSVADLISGPVYQSKDALQFIDLTSTPVYNFKKTQPVAYLTSKDSRLNFSRGLKIQQQSLARANTQDSIILSSSTWTNYAEIDFQHQYRPNSSRATIDMSNHNIENVQSKNVFTNETILPTVKDALQSTNITIMPVVCQSEAKVPREGISPLTREKLRSTSADLKLRDLPSQTEAVTAEIDILESCSGYLTAAHPSTLNQVESNPNSTRNSSLILESEATIKAELIRGPTEEAANDIPHYTECQAQISSLKKDQDSSSNNSSDEESEISNDSHGELEEFDDPVGVFVGGINTLERSSSSASYKSETYRQNDREVLQSLDSAIMPKVERECPSPVNLEQLNTSSPDHQTEEFGRPYNNLSIISPAPSNPSSICASFSNQEAEAVVKEELIGAAPEQLVAHDTEVPAHTANFMIGENSLNNSSDGESEISYDSHGELEEFDDPVGVFVGGEFGMQETEIAAESESESEAKSSESEWSGEICTSDDDGGDDMLEYICKSKRRTKTKGHSTGIKRSETKSTTKQRRQTKKAQEYNVSEAEIEEIDRIEKDSLSSNEQTKMNSERQQRRRTARCRKNARDFDASDFETEQSGNDISSMGHEPAENSQKRQPKKQIKHSYKNHLKLLKTVEEYDEFIAKWRPTLECHVCCQTSAKFSLLLQHFREHHPTEKCYISCCQDKFYYRHEIEKHIHYHNVPLAHKCEICRRCFTTKYRAKEHMKFLHLNRKPFKCPRCGKDFMIKSTLEHHQKKGCHNDQQKATEKKIDKDENKAKDKKNKNAKRMEKDCRFPCHICGKSFMRRPALTSHLKLHMTIPKNYQCSVCDKTYQSLTDFNFHIRRHTEGRPGRCPHCPRTYTTRAVLANHIKTFHRQQWDEKQQEKVKRRTMKKTYKCSECEKVYQTSYGLLEHRQSVHEGQNRFKCSICPKEYKYSSNVAAHFKRVHFKEWQKRHKVL